jgi:hypothetical protein
MGRIGYLAGDGSDVVILQLRDKWCEVADMMMHSSTAGSVLGSGCSMHGNENSKETRPLCFACGAHGTKSEQLVLRAMHGKFTCF